MDRLLSYEEWQRALGRSARGTYAPGVGAEVSLTRITGTVARGADFDGRFRPLRPAGRRRTRELARAMASGPGLPPVSLIRLGDLHFVEDGHHRIAAAQALGAVAVDAVVRSVCTVAFGCGDCTREHLAAKAAERTFLEHVALPDPELRDLWLDRPALYARLGAAAHAWATERGEDGPVLGPDLAQRWWHEEVLARAASGAGSGAERYLRVVAAT